MSLMFYGGLERKGVGEIMKTSTTNKGGGGGGGGGGGIIKMLYTLCGDQVNATV